VASGFERLVAKRRKPPPGYEHFFNEKRSGSGRQNPSINYGFHDGVPNPRGTGPFRKTKRSRGLPTNTRPTPGSASRIHNPQNY
jgi:hypothetical protein